MCTACVMDGSCALGTLLVCITEEPVVCVLAQHSAQANVTQGAWGVGWVVLLFGILEGKTQRCSAALHKLYIKSKTKLM